MTSTMFAPRGVAWLIACLAMGSALAQATSDGPGAARDDAPGDRARAIAEATASHPLLVALEESASAARRDLDALRAPVNVSSSAVWNRGDISIPEIPGPDGGPARTDTEWTQQLQVDVAFRPFLAGDLADAGDQRALAWQQAVRRLRETQATLQAAALEAAAAVHVAEAGVTLARAGEALAESAAEATRVRFDVGAATEADVRRADLSVARAREGVRVAEFRRADAIASLRDLTGSTEGLGDLPDLPPAHGPDPAVLRATDDVTLAQIGVRSARRSLLPTAQASYAWNFDDDSLSLSLESRTWQPTVSYAQPSALGAVALGVDPSVPAEFRPTLDGALTLAVTMEFSPATLSQLEAAEARLRAAEAARTSAQRDAEIAARRRDEAIRAAIAQVEFARIDLDLAVQDRDDARRRLDLGLVSPLELLDRERTVLDRTLSLHAAQLDVLSATLRGYRELGIPLTEVLP